MEVQIVRKSKNNNKTKTILSNLNTKYKINFIFK